MLMEFCSMAACTKGKILKDQKVNFSLKDMNKKIKLCYCILTLGSITP